jgi:hypothetical protein
VRARESAGNSGASTVNHSRKSSKNPPVPQIQPNPNHPKTRPQASDDTLAHIFGSILSWHFAKRGFPASLASLAAPLVAATLDVYAAAAAKLLPTPAKSHYLFNPRDFARVVQVGGRLGGAGGPLSRCWEWITLLQN